MLWQPENIYTHMKYLSVGKLIELLEKLPNEFLIFPTEVKNLSIGSVKNKKLDYLGFIDFLAQGEIDLFDKED